MSMFKDPATIKFVAKKFILSTNDPDNPISVVRQIHPDDTGKIEIFLTNGKSYTDDIDTLSDLISITSNKAFLVTIEIASELLISYAAGLSDAEMKSNILAAFSAYLGFDPEINPKYFFEPNKMFPRRVIPKSISTSLKGRTRWDSYSSNQEVFFNGITTFSFYVICPEDNIDDVKTELGEIMVRRLRETLHGRKMTAYSGRNLERRNAEEVEMEEALAFPDEWAVSIDGTLGNKHGAGTDDTAQSSLKDLVNFVLKELKVTRE